MEVDSGGKSKGLVHWLCCRERFMTRIYSFSANYVIANTYTVVYLIFTCKQVLVVGYVE